MKQKKKQNKNSTLIIVTINESFEIKTAPIIIKL
jgi:hypothetical protein